MRAVLSTLLLASSACLVAANLHQDAPSDVVHVTVTRTQYTCPCDSSTSLTLSGLPYQHSTETVALSYSPTPSGSTQCYSVWTADNVVSAPTHWSTNYLPCTSTITSSVTTNSTLPAVTSTITTTDTSTVTAPTSVSTATSTETDTETSTVTTTSTLTFTSTTTTTTTPTSTVAAPANFTPVQDSLPGLTYSGSGGADPVNKRDFYGNSNVPHNALGIDSNIASVRCISSTVSPTCSSTTTTSTSTVTVTAPTVSVTTGTTITTTFVPSATTTITTTTTSTSTTTSTANTDTTTTTTVTSTASTVTLYAACATNNLGDTYNSLHFSDTLPQTSTDYVVSTTRTDTAYDCCVAALTSPAGAAQAFIFFFGNCYFSYVTGQAVGAVPQSTYPWRGVTSTSEEFTIGNGPNGLINAVASS